MSNQKLSVIVVNYNSWKFTSKLIVSLLKIDKIIKEIIVIDNNSSKNDGEFSSNNKIKVIKNDENFGFSKAVNQAIYIACSANILLLNPDTEVIDETIIEMSEYLNSNPTIGAIGGKILEHKTRKDLYTANSRPTFLTALFEFTNIKKIIPDNVLSRKFWIEKNTKIIEPINVHSLCGAFILFRRNLNNTPIKFDEDYFMYLEDIQFGSDINKMGYKVVLYPNSSILHHGGMSNDSKYKTVLKYWYKSRKIFFKKNLNYIEGIILELIFSLEEKLLQIYHFFINAPNE